MRKNFLAVLLLCIGIGQSYAQENHNLYKKVVDHIELRLKDIDQCIGHNKLDSAILYINEAMNEVNNLSEEDRPRLAVNLRERTAAIKARQELFDEAIQIEEENLQYYQKYKGLPRKYTAVTLSNLAAYHASRGRANDLQTAIGYAETSLKHIPSKTQDQVIAMCSLANYYSRAGMRQKCLKVMEEVKKVSKTVFKDNPLMIAYMLSNQAISAAHNGNFKAAVDYSQQALEMYESNNADHSIAYCKLLLNKAAFHSRIQEYQQTIDILEKARIYILEQEDENSADYLRCISDLSAAHRNLGNLEQADDYALVTERSVNIGGSINMASGNACAKLAATLAQNGDYNRAINQEWKAINIYRQMGDSASVAMAYSTISDYYNRIQQFQTSRNLCKQSIAIYDSLGGNSPQKALALNSLSMVEFFESHFEDAYQYCYKALEICQSNADTLTTLYAKICNNMGLYCHYLEQHDRALYYAQRALDIQSRILGDNHPDNIDLYHNLAVYSYVAQDPKGVQHFLHQGLNQQMRTVRNNFAHLPSADRERYWNSHKGIFSIAPELVTITDVPDTVAIDVYNSLMFTKGILLNSEIDFQRFLTKNASPELLARYEELTALKEKLESVPAAELPDKQRRIDLLERAIVKECKEWGDFTATMSATTQDIGNALKEGQVAMEIFDVDVMNQGTTYMAMYLRHGWTVPRVVRLFCQKDIEDYCEGKDLRQLLTSREGINRMFTDTVMGQRVWAPLMREWEDVKEVFFAPTGVFYQWAVEYLMIEDSVRVNDRYQFHRLSSTRLLAQQQEPLKLEHAALFGGVKYDITPEQMVAVRDYFRSGEHWVEDDFADLMEPIEDSAERGSTLQYLPGTMAEIEAIGEMLAEGGITTEIFDGAEASEEAMHTICGRGIDLLHIATHGFSITPPPSAHEDLRYSGLMMAGAQNAMNHVDLPEGLEDGILTAHEIARLDLKGLGLVILSACQTGLGEVKEDGVFGLQRGFKKAGAQALMMSLWSVNDAATSAMMQAFYAGMLEGGKTTSEAFGAAQEQLRQQGYTEPYFWASFILLDALR